MSDNIPLQSSFLYESNWSHEIGSLILGTMIRLKCATGCEGTVFSSHFIFEAKSAIEYQLGYSFEWFELVDRLHFLEKRYKTFSEPVRLEGTYWDAPTNTIIVSANLASNTRAKPPTRCLL
ncbi:hypothetical protein AAHA92_21466 [Salvia divinorum]|uniref:Uncharacterized protein n=1 Tax=Salvia divinorum TaxID=28513 RepID=A0ABD1GNC4_SALDI